ncbi:hypothetical protein [Methylacidimicrobium tartarophylax]|uniref:Uncharacterized protein n=1 Tax=Methylacidimicrobium tartarophylax TaxID=1041768 RepID=A0A5E6MBZ5_9BACT|nr:hypothetical protein [Methylacidimicrobium tartarophylax]VVM05300.1 hypothetical protein MAMT_00568 [Methylacidimicrobium tartarophylax]
MARTHWKERCRDYVIGRQCRDGGFCFYRSDYIEESNLYDTGFALATFRVLGERSPRRGELESWLTAQSGPLCRNASLAALWSYERGVRLLGLKSAREIRETVERRITTVPLPSREELESWDASALLRDLFQVAKLSVWSCSPPPAPWRQQLSALLEALRGESGAFPKDHENLVDSARVFFLARIFQIPIEEAPILCFARHQLACSDVSGSWSTESASLEAVRCGLELLAAFSQRPEAQRRRILASQIEACQVAAGGFGRRIGAIPTLADSYHGAKALHFLE